MPFLKSTGLDHTRTRPPAPRSSPEDRQDPVQRLGIEPAADPHRHAVRQGDLDPSIDRIRRLRTRQGRFAEFNRQKARRLRGRRLPSFLIQSPAPPAKGFSRQFMGLAIFRPAHPTRPPSFDMLNPVAAVLNWAEAWDCMVFKGQWAEVWRRPALPKDHPRWGRSERW